MAKITLERVTKSVWFYVALALLLVVLVQYNDELNIDFLGATVMPLGQDVRITSHTNLAGKVLNPGSTVDVSVTFKNYGATQVDFLVEHRLVATSLFPSLMATISPASNAVSGQEDSVITQKVTGLKSGESVTLNFKAPVPTRQSVIDGKSNVDTSYYQVIGAYSKPGDGYLNNAAYVTHGGVLVNAAQAGSSLTQQCVVREDCNGWLIGNIECQSNACVEVPVDAPVSTFDFSEFYQKNKIVVLGLLFVLGMLILSISFDLGGQRS